MRVTKNNNVLYPVEFTDIQGQRVDEDEERYREQSQLK